MKKILFIALAVIVSLASCSDGTLKSRKFLGLKGSPKSVKITEYDGDRQFGEIVKGKKEMMHYFQFNKDGDIIKQSFSYTGKESSTVSTFENGKPVKTESYKDGKLEYVSTLEKNKGNKTVWVNKHVGGETTSDHFEISKRKTTIIEKDSKGNKLSRTIDTYDSKQNPIEMKKYDENRMLYWIKLTYNKNSQLLETKELSEDEEILSIAKFKYIEFDKKGNWTERYVYFLDEDEDIDDEDVSIRIETQEIEY